MSISRKVRVVLRFSGFWVENKLTGHGKQVFKGGLAYVGNFRDSLYDGYGELIYSDGRQ